MTYRRVSLFFLTTLIISAFIFFFKEGMSFGSWIELTAEEAFHRSEIVALGQVVEISRPVEKNIHQINGNRSIIYRDFTFKIEKIYKGTPSGSQIVIRVLGGTVGDSTFWVSTAIEPHPDKKQVLFLTSSSLNADEKVENAYQIIHPVGKYIIEGNPDTDPSLKAFTDNLEAWSQKGGYTLSQRKQDSPQENAEYTGGINWRKVLLVSAVAAVFLLSALIRIRFSRKTG
ncbi:MAG: hypothetical protein ACOY46_01405 [Bacillota bacterium]